MRMKMNERLKLVILTRSCTASSLKNRFQNVDDVSRESVLHFDF